MKTSEQINELATALSKAQSEMRHAEKDATNPHFRSSYATLASTWDAIREPLTRHGLTVVQTLEVADITVLCSRIIHSSGQWIESSYPVIPMKNDPQGFGSALTYARRYSLQAIVGISQGGDDDDGNSANAGGAAQDPKFISSTQQPDKNGSSTQTTPFRFKSKWPGLTCEQVEVQVGLAEMISYGNFLHDLEKKTQATLHTLSALDEYIPRRKAEIDAMTKRDGPSIMDGPEFYDL
jgi:hypothetical protein